MYLHNPEGEEVMSNYLAAGLKDDKTIIIETDEHHVATLTLNRPESMNTFSSQMAFELNR